MSVPIRFYAYSAVICVLALVCGYAGGLGHGYALWYRAPTPQLVDMRAELEIAEASSDGDTVRVRYGDKLLTVRMMGVDTPETRDRRKGKQCFGEEANRRTAQLIGKKLTFEFIPLDEPVVKRDRYDRSLVYVHLPDGSLYNEQLLRDGYAHQYTFRGHYKYRDLFIAAQKDAQRREVGMWKSEACAIESRRSR